MLIHLLFKWFQELSFNISNYPQLKAFTIGLMSRVFVNGLGDRGSIPGWVIPKNQEMVLNAALLNTRHYKVRIKGKMEPYLPLKIGVVAIEEGALGHPRLRSPTLHISRKGLNISFWPIYGILTGIPNQGQWGYRINGTEGVLHIPQILRLTVW